MKKEWKNEIYKSNPGPFGLIDLYIPDNFNSKLIIFIHGFWGFKDWGCWPLVEKFFISNGFAFCKYNITHGGTSKENPIEFVDSEALKANTYSKELDDLETVINWTKDKFDIQPEIYLIGHSRGGGIALLANENLLLKKICTWAAISSIEKRFPSGRELEKWEDEKVRYQKNSRTGQLLPQSIEIYYDFQRNSERLNIKKHCIKNEIPVLVIHGSDDTSVSITEGEEIAEWLNTELITIEKANHTFNSSHPWPENEMPYELNKVCEITLEFFKT